MLSFVYGGAKLKVLYACRATDSKSEILAFPTRHLRPTDCRAQRGEENLGVGPPDRPTLPEAGRGHRPESDNPTDRPSPRPGGVPTLSRSSLDTLDRSLEYRYGLASTSLEPLEKRTHKCASADPVL